MGCISSATPKNSAELSNGWVRPNALVLVSPGSGQEKDAVGRVMELYTNGKALLDLDNKLQYIETHRMRVIVNSTKTKPMPVLGKDGSLDRLPGGARENALVRTSWDEGEDIGRVLKIFKDGHHKGSLVVLIAPNPEKGRFDYERRMTGQSSVWVVANPTVDNPRPIPTADGGVGKAPASSELMHSKDGSLYAGDYAVDFFAGGDRGDTAGSPGAEVKFDMIGVFVDETAIYDRCFGAGPGFIDHTWHNDSGAPAFQPFVCTGYAGDDFAAYGSGGVEFRGGPGPLVVGGGGGF